MSVFSANQVDLVLGEFILGIVVPYLGPSRHVGALAMVRFHLEMV